jgi:hypothetical protein
MGWVIRQYTRPPEARGGRVAGPRALQSEIPLGLVEGPFVQPPFRFAQPRFVFVRPPFHFV